MNAEDGKRGKPGTQAAAQAGRKAQPRKRDQERRPGSGWLGRFGGWVGGLVVGWVVSYHKSRGISGHKVVLLRCGTQLKGTGGVARRSGDIFFRLTRQKSSEIVAGVYEV